MKKFLSVILIAVLLVSIVIIPFASSAKTKADVLACIQDTPTSKYFYTAMVNASRNMEITEAQADELYELALQYKAAVPEDKGLSAHDYTPQQVETVLGIIDRVCAILNLRYTMDLAVAHTLQHEGDQVIRFYSIEDNRVVFSYDGDEGGAGAVAGDQGTVPGDGSGSDGSGNDGSGIIRPTGVIPDTSSNGWLIAIGAVAAIALAGVTIYIKKENSAF